MPRQPWVAVAICVAVAACVKSEVPQVAQRETRLQSDVYGWVQVPWILADRFYPAMATLNGKVYLFGGDARNDLWAWDGARWERVDTPVRPPARWGHAMATLGSKIVLFGGSRPGYDLFLSGEHEKALLLDDTWEFDGQRWQEKKPTVKPPARFWHGMTEFQGKVVLNGGTTLSGESELVTLGDTWTWDGSEWTDEKSPRPPERFTNQESLASDGERVVHVCVGQSWRTWFWWDGKDWHAAEAAAPIMGAAVALDGSLLVVGSRRMWKWNGADWSELEAKTDGSFDSAIASLNGQLVKYGGSRSNCTECGYDVSFTTDTWSFDGVVWAKAAVSDSAPGRVGHAIATGADGAVLIHGGSSSSQQDVILEDTWRWDGVRWRQLQSLHRPTPTPWPEWTRPPMAAFGSKMILLAAEADGDALETWEWDGQDWSQRFPAHVPVLDSGSMASLGDRIVLKELENRSTTWEWDGNDWTEKGTAVVPGWITDFQGKAVAYSSSGLFEWDGAGWAFRTASGGPDHEGEIASLGGRLVAAYGAWEWDGSSWQENPVAGAPREAETEGMARQGDTLVLFGGHDLFGTTRARTLLYQRLLAPGSTCAVDDECLGGNCIDGVCCDTACRGQCESCVEPGLVGTCTPHAGTPLNGRALCGDGSLCEGSCDGTNRESCRYPAEGTPCSNDRCAMGIARPASLCDGAGRCVAAESPSVECAPYGCAGYVCATSCGDDWDCAPGYRCEDGQCLAKFELGESCGSAGACQSGLCIDGVCCESRCPGQCEACDVPGQRGKCLPIDGPPHEDRAACPGGGQCVAGACEAVAAEPDGCGCGSAPRGGAGGWGAVLLGLALLSAGARGARSSRRPSAPRRTAG